ncbi:sigma-70 RNA polymerase sigma factor region 4 domain-containing protein [Pedobacter nototheniae]|uniref:sigma-70 family RNA polymerase sigma factor n=1 Tax=Pedobacter nototheniae TaxID=2488994 RepID=UPI00103FD94D|nr:sigma-70 family RNA polymerase sigma factor [Pedobacter nototheniae]
MLKTSNHTLSKPFGKVQLIYQKYAAMLLGYIYGIVQDRQKSEEYLMKIFTDFSTQQNKTNQIDCTWLELRDFAKQKLAGTSNEIQIKTSDNHTDQHLSILTDNQRRIFCAVYYHGKSISYLASIFNQDESSIRQELKSSLDQIRKARGN